MAHLKLVHDTLNMVRNDNIAEASARDSKFWMSVSNHVDGAQAEVVRIRETILLPSDRH